MAETPTITAEACSNRQTCKRPSSSSQWHLVDTSHRRPWSNLPERYGSRGTVSSRFYRWRTQGVWQQVLDQLQQQGDAQHQIDWEVHFVDSTVVRAHQHAAGAKRGVKVRQLEHLKLPPLDISGVSAIGNHLTLQLGTPKEIEVKINGKFSRKQMVPGNVCITPMQHLHSVR